MPTKNSVCLPLIFKMQLYEVVKLQVLAYDEEDAYINFSSLWISRSQIALLK
jgi:hypothetical protein